MQINAQEYSTQIATMSHNLHLKFFFPTCQSAGFYLQQFVSVL